MQSIQEGASNRWAAFGTATEKGARHGIDGNVLIPGVQVLCSDLDFSLLSYTITGSMQSSRARTEPHR